MLALTSDLPGQRSRSRIKPFHLHRPTTVDEAVAAWAAAGRTAAFMAGGLDLINRMKAGVAAPSQVIHLGRVAELAKIEATTAAICVGACTSHHDLAQAPILRHRLPSIAAAWLTLGNPRIRFGGTVGGNVMAQEPCYDGLPMLMALGATGRLVGATGGVQSRPIGEIEVGEGLLVAIDIPISKPTVLLIDRSLKPVINVVAACVRENGLVSAVRVAIGCGFTRPWVGALNLPRPLAPAELARQAADLTAELTDRLPEPLDDWQASAGYRRRMAGVLLRRLLLRSADGSP